MQYIAKYKWIIICLGLLILVGGGGYKYWQSKATKDPLQNLRTAKVEVGNVRSLISATGTINPVNTVDISSKITGRIVDVKVKENDIVQAGQTLVLLDDAQAKSDLSQTQTKLNNLQLNYERNLQLYRDGAIAKSTLDTVETEYLVARAAYEKNLDNLADTVIKAPITGEVIGKPIPAGQTVAPGISTPMVLMTIADMSKMQIETLVDESDIGKVKIGQAVEFTVDSYEQTIFKGQVRLISKKAVTQQNVIYYTVYVEVEDTKNKLIPGMTARTNILLAESKNALIVPLNAIKDYKGEKYVQVYKKENGVERVEEVKVVVGLTGENGVEIKSGLKKEDVVVIRSSKNKDSSNIQARPPVRF